MLYCSHIKQIFGNINVFIYVLWTEFEFQMDCSIFWISLVIFPTLLWALEDSIPQYHSIWSHLLENYDNRVRPVTHPNSVLNVSMNIYVNNVLDLDAKSQVLRTKLWIITVWYDEFLKFDNSLYGTEYIAGDSSSIWKPDIVLHENVDEENPNIIEQPIFRLHHTGRIRWVPVVISLTACKFESHNYPFDVQVCPLTFASWVHTNEDVHFILDPSLSVERIFVTTGEWVVEPLKCQVVIMGYDNATFDVVACKLTLTRKPQHYIFNLVVPCLVLLVIGSFTFLLPVDSGEKISLSVTILLALTVFILVLMENLPANSDGIPFLGKFITACIILLAISTLMAVSVVSMVARGNDSTGSPPYWLETLTMTFLAKVVCYKRKICQKSEPQPENSSNRGSIFNVDSHGLLALPAKQEVKHVAERTAKNWLDIAVVMDRLYLVIYLVIVASFIATVVSFSHRSHL